MAKVNYSTKGISTENTAKAFGRALPISKKSSVEICAFIRSKALDKAKILLQAVIDKKIAVPFKRHNKDVGHKKGKIAAGRYPEKACKEILKMLESVEANAQFKGLNTANLVIKSIIANSASRPWHYGRQSRRKMKRTNIEIVVEERAVKKEEKVEKKKSKKEVKPEATPVVSEKEVKVSSKEKTQKKEESKPKKQTKEAKK